jgi:hypothetical protein
VPRWDAPEDISPALVHYIHHKGLRGNDAFSAALLSLAVKGHVTLEELGKKDMKIQATGNIPKSGVFAGRRTGHLQQGIRPLRRLPHRQGQWQERRQPRVGFRSKLASEHRNKYFVRNFPWIIAGVLMSAAAIAISLVQRRQRCRHDRAAHVRCHRCISSLFMIVFNALSKYARVGRVELCRHCALGRVRHHRIELPAGTWRHPGVHRHQPAADDRHRQHRAAERAVLVPARRTNAPRPAHDGRHRRPQDLYQAG